MVHLSPAKENGIIDLIFFPRPAVKIALVFFIILTLPLIYAFVWYTGGIKYVFSHSMYLPIVLASLFWGVTGGLPTAIAGAILLGPLMPIDVVTGEQQLTINWLFRAIFFLVIAVTVGMSSDFLKKYIVQLRNISIHNGETGMFNLRSLEVDEGIRDYVGHAAGELTVASILWNNIDDIVGMFGNDTAILIIREMQKKLENLFGDRIRILQSDSARLYAIVRHPDREKLQSEMTALFETPFEIKEVPYYVEVSLGFSPYQGKSDDLTPFQKASIASIDAKKSHRLAAVSDDDHVRAVRQNVHLLGEFYGALKSGQLVLRYQPKYDLRTKETIGIEALIRWEHPVRGTIAPSDFIPLIEESYLIHPLTEWVLKSAIAKLKELEAIGIETSIAINISPKNLQSFKFIAHLLEIVAKSDIKPNTLEFEITESVLMDDPDLAILLFQNLNSSNIVLSIDDFGTGFSSLSYLHLFPIDTIKIDRSFISKVSDSTGTELILESVVDMAHRLGFRVVAEGIEDPGTEQRLVSMGCDYGQGYYFAKPVKDSEIAEWLRNAAVAPSDAASPRNL